MKRSEIYILSAENIRKRVYGGRDVGCCYWVGKFLKLADHESLCRKHAPELWELKPKNKTDYSYWYGSPHIDKQSYKLRQTVLCFAAELAKDNERREAEYFDRIDRIAGKRKSGRSGFKIPTTDGMAITAGGKQRRNSA